MSESIKKNRVASVLRIAGHWCMAGISEGLHLIALHMENSTEEEALAAWHAKADILDGEDMKLSLDEMFRRDVYSLLTSNLEWKKIRSDIFIAKWGPSAPPRIAEPVAVPAHPSLPEGGFTPDDYTRQEFGRLRQYIEMVSSHLKKGVFQVGDGGTIPSCVAPSLIEHFTSLGWHVTSLYYGIPGKSLLAFEVKTPSDNQP